MLSTVPARSSLGRRATRPWIAALALAGAACIAVAAPTPAYAAGPIVEILNESNTSLRLDVMWASADAGAGVFLWPGNASTSQEFELIDSGGGFFRIKARHSGQCLRPDWRDGAVTDGTPIIQWWTCSAGYSPAEWSSMYIYGPSSDLHPGGEGHMIIKNRASGLCLDARNGSSNPPGQQAVVQMWDCVTSPGQWNAKNQMWVDVRASSVPEPPR